MVLGGIKGTDGCGALEGYVDCRIVDFNQERDLDDHSQETMHTWYISLRNGSFK